VLRPHSKPQVHLRTITQMAALQRPVLSPMDPNLPTRPLARKRSARATNPSPLRKESDYQLVAPLKIPPTTAPGPPPAPSSTANQKRSGDPKTPKAAVKDRKKKLLCATPPQVLQDTRGRAEYDRGRQLGEGGFARCFLVQNKEGELFAAKTVAKKSLQNQRMKAKVVHISPIGKCLLTINSSLERFKFIRQWFTRTSSSLLSVSKIATTST